ncbi:unnamed protein product [Nyctereutes procyonoides]|uniref:(raccoon dog) hypothetical protein n=1 Tax=Nyctereutes procyonoides TaxID=34880 RepID=A0A811ZRE0_NYCPR|nr:unnamed protein product [Nyctereutes procyonoides]
MEKKLKPPSLKGGRHVQGILQGFDLFMNLVMDECVKMVTSAKQNNIGMVTHNGIIMISAFLVLII